MSLLTPCSEFSEYERLSLSICSVLIDFSVSSKIGELSSIRQPSSPEEWSNLKEGRPNSLTECGARYWSFSKEQSDS